MILIRLYLAANAMLAPRSQAQDRASGGPTGTEQDEFAKRCSAFEPRIARGSLELVEMVRAGDVVALPYRDATCGGAGSTVPLARDVCRVAMFLETSARSGVQFEAWLPMEWSGRFLSTGNGGIGGCLDYNALLYTIQHGFASVASNNGHNGTSGKAFFGNDQVVEDFAGRSLHTITEVGKNIVKQFYKMPHSKSYFMGCSQGGRQGIASADKYPEDFDGIIAGSPALDFNNLISWRASFYPITLDVSSLDFIKGTTWSELIHEEVLKQCDYLDGVKDGILENPELCNFDPAPLLCRDDGPKDCLTELQIKQVRAIFSPLLLSDGQEVYPRMQPGSELRAIDRLYSGTAFSDSHDWFRYVVYEDATWPPSSFLVDRDARFSEMLNPFDIRTFPSNLDSFKLRNGKILMYHGLQDQQITSGISLKWYNKLLDKHTTAQLDEFLRYFRISGMYHCNSGPGAWSIGQGVSKVPFEGTHNVLAAIVDWVENGIAPDTLEGTKFDDEVNQLSIAFTRKHCRYPLQNRFIGSKETGEIGKSQAGDWLCVF